VEAIVPGRLRRSVEVNDAVIAARELVRKFGNDWKKAVTTSAHARYLKQQGFAPDVAFAVQVDAYPLVPVYVDRRVTVAERG
jgi:phosphosulfolactate phosphohydrolase-like enzyme